MFTVCINNILFNIGDLIGLTEEEVIVFAETNHLLYRFIKRDGKQYPVTRDYNPNRLNFTSINNIITSIGTG